MDQNDPKYIRAKERIKRIRTFYTNLITFVIVNLILLGINLITDPQNLWFYWITIIWGIVLIIQAINTFTLKNPVLGDEWEERKIKKMMDKEDKPNDQ
ncbi:MAG: hypothetical protein S4CHLAM45_10140 [Chlamydiales bacterium]|nr:hypothetical protein [Chlamydiales bacterium]MCH9620170.1 hypothetical protein [Chlamydiales bacterium]MCH9623115.1 hypothetical protein [Chlamydiales bacterium]